VKGATVQTTTPGSDSSVLIVEDNHEIREVISSALAGRGYQVRSACGAADALAQLERDSRPDVILLDLMMPGMSGWEFRVEQRQKPRLADIPVVAMSADTSAQAKAIDADAYLAKPFEPQDLVDAIERVLLASERSRLRAHLAESERLRALGLLAAGVAHEVNNPLTVIAGCAELSVLALNALDTHVAPEGGAALRNLSKYLADIARSAERIAGVVRGIATLGRPDVAVSAEVDVREALTTSIRLVTNEIRHRARLVRNLQAVPPVRGSLSKLVQVFVNILTNAAHSIPEGSQRTHEVRVATAVSSRGDVVIDISDSGCGMTREVRERVFEPFFTTKPVGSGMGLGLSISHRLISELGGTIAVTSSLGNGSSFRIELPAAVSTTAMCAVAPAPAPLPEPHSLLRRRLLVIDDEPQVGDLLSCMLRDAYDVSTRTSVSAALDLLQESTFDAVLCDLMMPDLNGMDLHAELVRQHSDLARRILFMTGGAFTERASVFVAALERSPIAKPFQVGDVIRRLDEVFSSERTAASATAS
jgi:signal transduction histidine kinase